jgi:hypothetical protein
VIDVSTADGVDSLVKGFAILMSPELFASPPRTAGATRKAMNWPHENSKKIRAYLGVAPLYRRRNF